jgi:hypothetical protein
MREVISTQLYSLQLQLPYHSRTDPVVAQGLEHLAQKTLILSSLLEPKWSQAVQI